MELQVGVKIILKNEKGEILMLLRSAEKYPEAGALWEIPGGRINPGTPLLENLRREVKEETGIDVVGEPKILAAQDILKSYKNNHIVRITYMGHSEGEVKLSDEHTDFQWVALDRLNAVEPMDGYLKEVLQNFDLS